MIRFQSNYHGNLVFKKQVLTAHSELKASYHVIISIFDQNEEELLIKDFQTCGNIAHIVDTRLGGDVKVQIKHKGGFSRYTSFIDLGIYDKDRPFRLGFSSKTEGSYRPMIPQIHHEMHSVRDTILETIVVPLKKKAIQILEIENIPRRTQSVSTCRISDSSTRSSLNTRKGSNVCLPESVLDFVRETAARLPNAKKIGQPIQRHYFDRRLPIVDFSIYRSFASHCYNIGREHRSHGIILSIDFLNGSVYQRCWDNSCRSCGRYDMCLRPPKNVLDQLENMHRANSGFKPGHSPFSTKVLSSDTNLDDSHPAVDPTLIHSSNDDDKKLAEFDIRSPDDAPLYLLASQPTQIRFPDDTPLYLLASQSIESGTGETPRYSSASRSMDHVTDATTLRLLDNSASIKIRRTS